MRVVILVPVFLLSACGSGDRPAPSWADVAGVAGAPEVRCETDIANGAPRGSHFSGHLIRGGSEEVGLAEGILTEYGEIRIHITDTGGVPNSHFTGVTGRISGNGELRVEACSGAESCAQFAATYASIYIAESCGGSFSGWLGWGNAPMGHSNYPEFAFGPAAGSAYGVPATPDDISGSYSGQLAGEELVISIDAAGGLFFQQVATGCVANGSASPHRSGFNVYDVELEISNCVGDFENLNRQLTGLATLAAEGDPGLRERLVLWLSTPGRTYEGGNDPALFVAAERL